MNAVTESLPEGLVAAIHEQIAAGGVRRFLPVERMSTGATEVVNGAWTVPIETDDGVVTAQTDTTGVIELVGRLAVTREQSEAEDRDHTVVAAVRKLARGAVAIEDYAIVRGCDPGTAARFGPGYGLSVAPYSPRNPPGLMELSDNDEMSITARSGGRVDLSLVSGLNKVCTDLHESGREGPYAIIVSMDVHQLLRSRTADRDVPEQLLPGDVEHVLGMRALEENTGLVIALGGQPVELLLESETLPVTDAGHDGEGRLLLQLRHRFALRVRDRKAITTIKFT